MGKKKDFAHRSICRKAHGEFPGGWHVHHIDGNHKNNSPENLIAIPERVHVSIHRAHLKNGQPLPAREAVLKIMNYYQLDMEKYAQLCVEIKEAEAYLRKLKRKKEAWEKP